MNELEEDFFLDFIDTILIETVCWCVKCRQRVTDHGFIDKIEMIFPLK